MVRPQHLGPAIYLDGLERFFTWMVAGKGNMAGWMPVLGAVDDKSGFLEEGRGARNLLDVCFVCPIDRQAPFLPRGEITLHINDDHTCLLTGCNCRQGSHTEQHRQNNYTVNENHHVSHNLSSFGFAHGAAGALFHSVHAHSPDQRAGLSDCRLLILTLSKKWRKIATTMFRLSVRKMVFMRTG